MVRYFLSKAVAAFGLAAAALLLLQPTAMAQNGFGATGTGAAGTGAVGTGSAAGACASGTCATGTCGSGSTGTCGDCFSCQRTHCPPCLKWCSEGPVKIRFIHGCPRPVVDPCTAPYWGYYQTCWTPWPWPPDWSHCPVPPPASMVFPGQMRNGVQQLPEMGPLPRPLDARPPL